VVEPIVRALLIERHGLEVRAARSGCSGSAVAAAVRLQRQCGCSSSAVAAAVQRGCD
jgi:hypothetical protein